MRLLVALVFLLPYALAQFCGPDEIPDKIAVNDNGEVALGCRYNECPRTFNGAGIKSSEAPKCGNRYYELSCAGPLQWVGGIPRGSNINNVVPLQCCTAQKLRDSPQGKSRKIVEPGQVFEGQEYRDKVGNVVGYDIIKNAQKVRVAEGRYGLSVTVSRLSCEPKRAAQLDREEVAEQGFGDVVRQQQPQGESFQFGGVGAGGFGGPPGLGGIGGPPGLGQGIGDFPIGDQFGDPFIDQAPPPVESFAPPPPQAFPAALPVGDFGAAGGVCFHGDTMLETPSGPKRMDELKIGDQVLAISENNVPTFSPVKSFLHRLPEKKSDFHRIQSSDGGSIRLTPMHFIYTTPCDQMSPKMKYARDVSPGKECLVRVEGEKQTPVAITSNTVEPDMGIYNPMTETGTVVADGFMASCHNVVNDESFMNTFIDTVRYLQSLMSGESGEEKKVELPWAVQFCVDYASKFF